MGYVFYSAGCPLLWVSKMQTEIELSTTEAEHIALSQVMHNLLPTWQLLAKLTGHLDLDIQIPIVNSTVFEDNKGCITLASAPKMTPSSKHIGIKYHFFHEHVTNGTVQIKHIESENQLADIFTKGLGCVKFETLHKRLLGW